MKTLEYGTRVRVSRPEAPASFRRGQVGRVDAVSVYQPRPSPAKPGEVQPPPPPPRLMVWVMFNSDGLGRQVPTRTPFWDSELEVISCV